MSENLSEETVDIEHMIGTLKEGFMVSLAQAAHDMLPNLVEELVASDDPELKRKFISEAANLLGWKRAAPKDANDNLPVFNFNFGSSGQVQVTTVAPDGTQQQLEFIPNDMPIPAVMQSSAIVVNDDVLFGSDE